jgi:hypothetical protein
MVNRNIYRDLTVYSVTSARCLLIKGRLHTFIKDMAAFSEWRKYRISEKGTLDHKIPWLVFSSIRFLKKWLKKDMQVFEYGSGGSTLFFAENTSGIVSVEHDKSWFTNAKKAMDLSGLQNISYNLIEPEQDMDFQKKNNSDPRQYISGFAEYRGKHFKKYASVIDAYPDAYFDLVIIDGRARSSCIMHAMQKVKINGVLLVDNADRKQYLSPFPELLDKGLWTCLEFTGHFPYAPASVLNTTKIFIKK